MQLLAYVVVGYVMNHLPMSECRRIAEFAASPACGQQQRRDIVDTLGNSLTQRQADPRADPDEVVELVALLVKLNAIA
jgi:hypothetical protein